MACTVQLHTEMNGTRDNQGERVKPRLDVMGMSKAFSMKGISKQKIGWIRK